jgi:Na+(H+)/acetate symporter ActP
MPEYIKKRFSGNRIRMLLSILSLMLNVFIRITADLFGGALFIKMYLNLDLYFSIGILLILSALFTIGGKNIHLIP